MQNLVQIFIEQIWFVLPYWIAGILIGSAISVFGKEKLNLLLVHFQDKCSGLSGLVIASLIGIISPLCLYGTIPVVASLSQKKVKDDWLVAFMMSSVLLNPQLLIYTMALGVNVALIRFILCWMGGIIAGLLVRYFFKDKTFFYFGRIYEGHNHDTNPDMRLRFLFNIGRNIKATGGYFLLGIVLATLFLYFLPNSWVGDFMATHHQADVLLMTLAGIPFYVCGGGAIPLLAGWLQLGLSLGAALAFTISGASTKLTNLTAVKMILGVRNFIYYIVFVCLFAVISGLVINVLPEDWITPHIEMATLHYSHHY